MPAQPRTRREFLRMMGVGAGVLGMAGSSARPGGRRTVGSQPTRKDVTCTNAWVKNPPYSSTIGEDFFVRPNELTLRFSHGRPERRLSFDNFQGSPEAWKKACRDKLAELLGLPRQASPREASSCSRRVGSQPTRKDVARTNAWVKDPPYSDSRMGFSPCCQSPEAKKPHGLKPILPRSDDPIAKPSGLDAATLAASRDTLHADARLLRSIDVDGVKIEAWVMTIDASLSIPAYLLSGESLWHPDQAIVALHGHGAAEPCVGLRDELCPALRGFGALGDMAFGDEGRCLDYWRSQRGRQFTLISDALLYGRTLIGETVADLLRWESWLARTKGIRTLDVAGISYGGDLALTYPPFSHRVRRIYSSGSLGSFAAIFPRCYNAPAHGIPGILNWMDRSDIAGLNAPRPIQLHYGEKDTPGPTNNSASYNETVEPALAELKRIYRAFDAENQISFKVTTDASHEIDNEDLQDFLAG